MKKELIRNLLATVLTLLMVTMSSINIFAMDYYYDGEAAELYKSGLYKGVSTTSYEPSLGMLADREIGIIMLLRLLNEEKKALDLENSIVDELLSNFADSSEISGWARKQFAYATKVGILKGYPDKTLKPKEMLTSKTYCTMILKALGYDFEFNEAFNLFCDLSSVLNQHRLRFMEDKPINRDLLVGISYYSISLSFKQDGRTLRQKLLDDGVVKLGPHN